MVIESFAPGALYYFSIQSSVVLFDKVLINLLNFLSECHFSQLELLLKYLFKNGRTIHQQIVFKTLPHPSLLGAFCRALSNRSPGCSRICALNSLEQEFILSATWTTDSRLLSEDSVQSAHGCSVTSSRHPAVGLNDTSWSLEQRKSNTTSPLGFSSSIRS